MLLVRPERGNIETIHRQLRRRQNRTPRQDTDNSLHRVVRESREGESGKIVGLDSLHFNVMHHF